MGGGRDTEAETEDKRLAKRIQYCNAKTERLAKRRVMVFERFVNASLRDCKQLGEDLFGADSMANHHPLWEPKLDDLEEALRPLGESYHFRPFHNDEIKAARQVSMILKLVFLIKKERRQRTDPSVVAIDGRMQKLKKFKSLRTALMKLADICTIKKS